MVLLLFILLGLGNPKPLISPSKLPFIAAGSSVQFKANIPVKWSLAAGSPGTMDDTGTYHAPLHVPAHNNLAGCQVLPNDHILNTRIDSLPVSSQSADWSAILPDGRLSFYPAWGTNIADSSTPKQNMHFLYSQENDGKYEIPPWPELQRENGFFSGVHSDVDRHVLTVDRESCTFFELYNNYSAGELKDCPNCNANGGVTYSAMSYVLPTGSSDAAGLFLAPLTIHLSEVRSGHINHAARFTLANAYVAPSSVWPSRAHAGAWGKVPYGTRFRLRHDFDVSRFGPTARIFLTQLKEYGLILADGGANWDIQTSTDLALDPTVEAAMAEVASRGPHAKDFQVVDESQLMVSENSGQVKNSDIKDEATVTVIATDAGNSENAASLKVPLRSITVGVPAPSIWIQSGVQTQLKAWVNGGPKSLKWSVSPALGTISSRGYYSAPKVDHPETTIATAASEADPESTATIAVTVMPPGPVRVKVGNASQAPGTPNRQAPDYGPDSEGHMWWRDQAGEVSWGVVNDDWYGEPWPKQKDISLYYTSRYSFGDMLYRFLLPNGNYKISLYFAQPQCKDHFPKEWRAPMHVEAQGQIILRDFDIGSAIDHACLTPTVQSIPATVTDNSLYFALRRITLPGSAPSPLLNAYSIVPDSSSAHLVIDPAVPRSLVAGEQLPLHSVGWYMSSDATWSLNGPGFITKEGLYTAPPVSPAADSQVTVEAHSKSDPAKQASVRITLKSTPLVISPENATVTRGLSQKFNVTFGRAPYSNVEWSVSPNIGSISPDGVYTAPASLAEDARVVVSAHSRDLVDRKASSTITIKAAPEVIRIHCGEGPGFKDAKGNFWAEDHGFSKDTIAYRNTVPISGTTPDMQYLYQSARYRYADQPFSYEFAVPNGRYSVTLKFADYAFTEAGHYSFDVKLNGKKVLSHFDPDKEKGARWAVDKTFQTTVTGKSIHLDFHGDSTAAFINGIEIDYLGPE